MSYKGIRHKAVLIVGIFRPLRWYRNIFLALGALIAIGLLDINYLEIAVYIRILLVFIATCFVASGNYGINEILDAESDKHHPKKKHRAIPSGEIKPLIVFIISLVLYSLGFVLIIPLGNYMLLISIYALFISGILYNVRPFRFKDLPYLDFIFEAVNNPIRLLIGWYAVATVDQVVPSSLLLTYWFFGIFLMAGKRFGEIRFIDNKEEAGLYRKSFKYYSEEKLLFVLIAAINASSYMLGALSMKYRIDLVLLLPFVIIWIVWFFNLAYKKDSIVKDPERVLENIPFLLYSVTSFLLFVFLVVSDVQLLDFLIK